MTLSELMSVLDYLDVQLSVCGDELAFDAPHGVLNERIMADLREHKPALIARLSSPARGHESQIEIHRFRQHPWREEVSRWPIPWRESWGRLANVIEDGTRVTDQPASWREAEQRAYALLMDRFHPQADPLDVLDEITKELGWPQIMLSGCTGDGVEHVPLEDAEAVAAIDRSFADPAPVRRTGRQMCGTRIDGCPGTATRPPALLSEGLDSPTNHIVIDECDGR